MPFAVEMTGAQDYQRTVKMAVGGYPGTGKTLFASTAPQVFYIFFRDQPRIMSIADRYMPHTKVVNKLDDEGRLKIPVWETLLEVIEYLESSKGEQYKSVTIDTGDELFQALKEGRKAQNRGKFAIQDWGWLGDTYREIINRIIDLPKHVIVTYHLKATQEGDDGEILREIALQGQAKDEVAGWFDIVGVLDAWEEETEAGKVLHRGLLTHTTPKYPFVKDHSGKLPKVFELSDNFVGDFERLHKLIYAAPPASDHETLEVVTVEKAKKGSPAKTSVETGVPTPADVEKKKGKTDVQSDESEAPDVASETGDGEGASTEGETADAPGVETPEPEAAGAEEGPADAPEPEEEEAGGEDSEPEPESGDAAEVDKATDLVESELGATTVAATCEYEEDDEVCGKPLVKRKVDELGNPIGDENGEPIMVPDTDLMDLTKIRFRKHMCREHFTKARKG